MGVGCGMDVVSRWVTPHKFCGELNCIHGSCNRELKWVGHESRKCPKRYRSPTRVRHQYIVSSEVPMLHIFINSRGEKKEQPYSTSKLGVEK